MKNFHLTVYTIITLFFVVLCTVATVAFVHTSNNTKIDPAQIKKMREMVKK